MNKYESIRFRTLGPASIYFSKKLDLYTSSTPYPDVYVELPADRINPWWCYNHEGKVVWMIFSATATFDAQLEKFALHEMKCGRTKIAYSFAVDEKEYKRLLEVHNLFEGNPQSFLVEKEAQRMKLPTCDCIATANSPEFIRAKNEEYRKNYEKALAECEQNRPESFKSWSEEHISKILRSYEGWDKFTKEERSWLKCRLEVELLRSLRYVGQLPPCCRAPIIVDQDFQYLYQGLRIDPDLVKRVSKGKLEECGTKT